MTHLYGTYRMAYTNDGNRYSISYFLNNELADYKAAGIISMEDMAINDNQYTAELAPWLKSMTRFFKATYNEQFVPVEHFEIVKTKMIANNYATFWDNTDDAIAWVKANTNLVEVEPWKFLTQEADEEFWTEAVYLTIE